MDTLQNYLSWKVIETPRAAENYSRWLERFIKHVNKSPEDYTVMDFVNFHGLWKGRVKDATLSLAMLAVRDFVRYLFENQLTKTSYRYVPLVRSGTFSHHASVSPEEVDKMIRVLGREDNFRNLRDAAVIAFLFDTGLRVSEFTGLDISSLQVELRQGKVRTLKKRSHEEYRPFFWTERTHYLLSDYLQKRNVLTRSPALWISLDRSDGFLGRIIPRAVERLVCRAVKLARIEGKKIVVHSFRHGNAIETIMRGGTNADVQNFLGHSSLESTKPYTVYNPKEARDRYFQLRAK